jgi:hypothetical protein
MPSPTDSGGVDLLGLLYLALVLGVMFFPVLLGRFVSQSGESDSGADDGGGGGPSRPPSPPGPSPGGIPLPDAEQAQVRLRDHRRLADPRRTPERRPAHDPERAPARVDA